MPTLEPRPNPRPTRLGPTLYVQRKGQGYLETVDQFEGWKEARAMLREYRMSDPSAHYYLSQRACRAWLED